MARTVLKKFRVTALALAALALPVAAQMANPSLLPQALRQLPDFQAYNNADVPAKSAGQSYVDPVTQRQVFKLTSPQWPVPNNLRGYHDYSEAGPYISGEWGAGFHTVFFHVANASNTNEVWLVDYQRGVGILQNTLRPVPYPMPGGNAFSFSTVEGQEHIAYVLHEVNASTAELIKLDTTDDGDGQPDLTDDGSLEELVVRTVSGLSGQPKWLQVSRLDQKIVFSAGNSVYAYDSSLNPIAGSPKTTVAPLDEPALDRAGNYVLLRRGGIGNEDPNCSSTYANLEAFWYLWDLNNPNATLVCDGDPNFPLGHTGAVQGYFPAHNPNSAASPNFYYNVGTDQYTNTADYAEADFMLGNHYAAQWIQEGVTGPTQWYFGSNYEEGEANAQGWTALGGGVYSTSLDWTPQYQKPQIGVKAVYQVSDTVPGRYDLTLAPASSSSSVGAGQFYWDQGTQTVYVHLRNDHHPSGRIKMAAPGPVHNAVGVRRLDGSEVRLLAHTYSWPDQYEEFPFATVSPDGKLAMFASTMGIDMPGAPSYAERTDVFVVEIPDGTGGDPGPGGGTPVVWTNDQGLQKNGNTIVETCGCGTARAESQQVLLSGDGAVEFVAGSDHGMFAIGIGDGPPSSNPADIESSLRFYGPNNGVNIVEVREGANYVTDTTYTEGQRFRIEIVDGDVNYFKYVGSTPTLIISRESPPGLQYPVKVEAILLAPETSVQQAMVWGNGSGGGGGGDITWTNLSNATASGTTLTETGGVGDSGAQSTQTLSGDGYMEFTAVEIDKMRAVGLNAASTDNTFQEIDFAIVLRQSTSGTTAVAEVWENGTYRADTPYSANTRFRIAIENGVIKYFKYVGATLTEIPVSNPATVTTFPVRVDAALYGPGSTIANVTLVPE